MKFNKVSSSVAVKSSTICFLSGVRLSYAVSFGANMVYVLVYWKNCTKLAFLTNDSNYKKQKFNLISLI